MIGGSVGLFSITYLPFCYYLTCYLLCVKPPTSGRRSFLPSLCKRLFQHHFNNASMVQTLAIPFLKPSDQNSMTHQKLPRCRHHAVSTNRLVDFFSHTYNTRGVSAIGTTAHNIRQCTATSANRPKR